MTMNRDEYDSRLHKVIYTASLNARYHQTREHKFDWWDKAVRILVAGMAVLGLIFAFPHLDSLLPDRNVSWIGFFLAILSLVVAFILNIVPITERAKFHGYMFRGWSELRKDAVLEEQKTCEIEPTKSYVDRLAELVSKMESLHADEPYPDTKLLRKCQELENESVWGRGVRTYEQVENARLARRASEASASAVSVADQE